MKDVSIVLCPYNNGKNFKRTLDMIYAKTDYDFNKVEIIVVDNNTEDKLKKETKVTVGDKKEVKLLYNNNEQQLAGATNLAINEADSKYFVYLCSNSVYIYNNQWLKYMINEMSDTEYTKGVRLGGTLAWCINNLPVNKRYHVQGGIFIGFTEYMKKNRYTPKWPFSFMDVYYSENCLRQGFQLKNLLRVLSVMGPVQLKWHEENKHSQRQYIAHFHGLENLN